MMKRGGSTYILSNRPRGVLYVGSTEEPVRRMLQHKQKEDPHSFTARYNTDKLVYIEHFGTIVEARTREYQIKAGSRGKKIALVEGMNPEWKDLFDDLAREWGS